MARGQLDAFRRQQVEERIMRRRRHLMDRSDNAFVLLGSGDGEHVRIARGDLFRLGAHAAGDDDLAVLRQRRADRFERLRLRGLQKPAGVDDREIGARMGARELVALGAQSRDDALGIDQRLGAAEGDKAHLRRAGLGHARLSVWTRASPRAAKMQAGARIHTLCPSVHCRPGRSAGTHTPQRLRGQGVWVDRTERLS